MQFNVLYIHVFKQQENTNTCNHKIEKCSFTECLHLQGSISGVKGFLSIERQVLSANVEVIEPPVTSLISKMALSLHLP